MSESDKLPQLEGTGDASIAELLQAAEEENKQAIAEQAAGVGTGQAQIGENGDPIITVSDEDITEDIFFEEFEQYFNVEKSEATFTNIHDEEIHLRIERLGILHLRKYKKKIFDVGKKLQDGSLPCDVTRDEAGNITEMKILWVQAWPMITDIVVEDLLELIMDSISIKENDKYRSITEDEFNLIDISDFPFIVVPWIRKNFADPKRKSPWQRLVKGLLGKFGMGQN